jgi:hypothetical protein
MRLPLRGVVIGWLLAAGSAQAGPAGQPADSPTTCDDCVRNRLVYLERTFDRTGRASAWRLQRRYASAEAADSLLELANRGGLAWSRGGPRGSRIDRQRVVMSLVRPDAEPERSFTSDQVAWLEGMLPGWLARLRRSDPGLKLTEFRRRYTFPLTLESSVGTVAMRKAMRIRSTDTIRPTSGTAFDPAKWRAGILSRSPDGRYIFDHGTDLAVMPDGELGGDCGGGWAIYDAATHVTLWRHVPGLDDHPRGAAWAGDDVVVLHGLARFHNPDSPQLEFHVPAIWIFDLAAGQYSRWDAPPGPQFVFAGRPE